MIKTFTYRTEIKGQEFQHTVHASSIGSSIEKWINQIDGSAEQAYSFGRTTVDKIKTEYDSRRVDLKLENTHSHIKYSIDGKIQITYIDKVDKGTPDFIADLKYLTTNEGGRRTCAFSGYRPHFQLDNKKEMTSAEQLFVDKDMVCPGDSVTAEIRILGIETFKGLLYNGQKFNLGEGPRIVAVGIIKEVINEQLKKNNS